MALLKKPSEPTTRARSRSVQSRASSTATTTTTTTTTKTSDTQTINEETHSDGSNPKKALFYLEVNPFAPTTVVMIHILTSCHLEWQFVQTKLPEYHLLLPDLPQHSRSRQVRPFSFAFAADMVADMIREHAHDGRAHLVGVSTGGFIALEIAKRYPELVSSIFVSGCAPLSGSAKHMARYPTLTYWGLKGMLHSPSSLLLKISGWSGECYSDELVKEIKHNSSSRLYEAGARETRHWGQDDVAAIAKADRRIALVASARMDDMDAMKEMGKTLKASAVVEGKETRVFAVHNANYAWNLQIPALFAQGIRSWVEKRPLPPEYRTLLE